jgi:translocation and assembly module TamB
VLTAVQSDGPPWGRGELRIANGTFNAFGQQLDIERGRLMYSGGPLDNPGLEIRTVRRSGAITTGAQVRGTLQQPEVSLFSDPPMARAEILAYLSFGTSLANLQSSERGAVNQAAGTLAASGGSGLVRDITRRLGLGNADVAVEGGVDGAALVMGRYLGSGLYVGYGLGMFDTVNTLRLRLRINSRLALEATSSDVVTADLVHTIERD